jgi:hypothetical protein
MRSLIGLILRKVPSSLLWISSTAPPSLSPHESMPMPSNVKHRSERVQQQISEMSWAVPQVVTERLTRMALAGVAPNARDQQEFQKMGAEKVAAFCESWMALGQQMMLSQQEMSLAWVNGFTQWPSGQWPANHMAKAAQSAAMGMLGAALAPVHSRAIGNARRLAKQ